jgi:glycosyltransferase involved in cell wall biosynthesis
MRIVLYTGYHSKPWNPNTLQETGLGGTEQCVLYLAKYLAFNGRNEVWVVGDIISGLYDNVKYRTTEEFKQEVDWVDLIISASYIHYLKEFENFNYKNSIFWVHNTDYYPWWNGEEIENHRDLLLHPKLSKIVCLTYWHKSKWLEQFPETKNKIEVIPNGIEFKNFVPMFTSPKTIDGKLWAGINSKLTQKIKNQFIYTSHAERGLYKVLEDWSSIKEQLPDATLKISTPEYGLKYFEENFIPLISNLDDVEFLGTLPQQELYQLMAQSQYWYYPSNYEETFCITALEMLGHKVTPVTWEWAGLKETLKGFNALDFEQELDWRLVKNYLVHSNWRNIADLYWIKLLLNLNMNLDYFYVISLTDTQELRDKCSRVELPQSTGRYEIKKGFHYQDLTPEELEKYGVNKHPKWKIKTENNLWNRDVTDGEIGCSLSHVDAWIDSYCQDRDITMILEEDFDQQLPVPWEQINGLLGMGYDLIYLGRNALEPNEEIPIEGYPNWVEPSYTYNTQAYILSKKGLELLVEQYADRYKNQMFVIDEFFSVAFKKTQRTDILAEFEDLPALKVAAPLVNYFVQSESKGLTDFNRDDSISTTDVPMESNNESTDEMPEIMRAGDWDEWCKKYINPHILQGQYKLMVDEIAPNVIEFPLFTEKFCNEIIKLAEQRGEWVTDRHTFYPTTDQTMESLGMQLIYQAVLERIVYPVWIWFWELDGDGWNTARSENFIAKYNTENQGSLDIHHDDSSLTLNVRLNDEFKGGGTYIPRYKTTIQPRKKGYAMAHPGKITHKHGGRPVEEGTRYILVSFTNP